MSTREFEVAFPCGLKAEVFAEPLNYGAGRSELISDLDQHRGALLSSGFEVPGRYTRWDLGFIHPPVAIEATRRDFRISALNERGKVLLPAILDWLDGEAYLQIHESSAGRIAGRILPENRVLPEESRSKARSIFSLIRHLIAGFATSKIRHFGLYGAFGYDLAFQFEDIALKIARPLDHRDLVLFLPDRILFTDHQAGFTQRLSLEFSRGSESTAGLSRMSPEQPFVPRGHNRASADDHAPGDYAETVREAREHFRRGDLFETVPGQLFRRPTKRRPSALFQDLSTACPAPYGFLMNLGESEFLIGASPEMFVRVRGRRVESCPISGTIARGADAIEEAANIGTLLASEKDAAELTMCTDVDRNDKSRVCRAGSVRILGRRQVERHGRVLHTVDHVAGELKDGYDGIDAFLTHAWAVTVTGAPKKRAMQFIEDHERSARAWYGGAVGALFMDGDIETGIAIRTLRLKDGRAEVRAGATLLWDSDPDAEEAETQLKASALLAVLEESPAAARATPPAAPAATGRTRKVLLIDHDDSFIHTLSNYFRLCGAEVITYRWQTAQKLIDGIDADLAVLSPGPGRPEDFDTGAMLQRLIARRIPVFGVCLGLQAMVVHFGGDLSVLPAPRHGKASQIRWSGGASRFFPEMPVTFSAGRYHSIVAQSPLPRDFAVIAVTEDDGQVMAVEHRHLPMAAVQFHPESLMTLGGDAGLKLIAQATDNLATDNLAIAKPAGRNVMT